MVDMRNDELAGEIAVELTPVERDLLRQGVQMWGGPAYPSNELAVAMGFVDAVDLDEKVVDLQNKLRVEAPLSPRDWTRVLIATEIAFASDVLGAGVEWHAVSNIDDATSIRVLRSIQMKLVSIRVPIGTFPEWT